MYVESISFNWHLLRNTYLTYDEMWKRRMYLASEIISEFIFPYSIIIFGHFWPKHLFRFKKILFVRILWILSLNLWNKLEILCYWVISCQRGRLNRILHGYKALIYLISRIPCNYQAQNLKVLKTTHILWKDWSVKKMKEI